MPAFRRSRTQPPVRLLWGPIRSQGPCWEWDLNLSSALLRSSLWMLRLGFRRVCLYAEAAFRIPKLHKAIIMEMAWVR